MPKIWAKLAIKPQIYHQTVNFHHKIKGKSLENLEVQVSKYKNQNNKITNKKEIILNNIIINLDNAKSMTIINIYHHKRIYIKER